MLGADCSSKLEPTEYILKAHKEILAHKIIYTARTTGQCDQIKNNYWHTA